MQKLSDTIEAILGVERAAPKLQAALQTALGSVDEALEAFHKMCGAECVDINNRQAIGEFATHLSILRNMMHAAIEVAGAIDKSASERLLADAELGPVKH
jgi:hypothetical protein